MPGNQVLLCFDKEEDALLFALAAGLLMSAEAPVHGGKAAVRAAEEIRKASRIRTACSGYQLKDDTIQ